jgi:hypothetical protein
MPSGRRLKCARIPADRRRFLKLPLLGGLCSGLGASCSGAEGRQPALSRLARSSVLHRREIDSLGVLHREHSISSHRYASRSMTRSGRPEWGY